MVLLGTAHLSLSCPALALLEGVGIFPARFRGCTSEASCILMTIKLQKEAQKDSDLLVTPGMGTDLDHCAYKCCGVPLLDGYGTRGKAKAQEEIEGPTQQARPRQQVYSIATPERCLFLSLSLFVIICIRVEDSS